MINVAAISRQQGDELLARAVIENQQNAAANEQLLKDNESLEKREHYYSAAVITAVGLLLGSFLLALGRWRVRMVTAKEDRELKKLEIEKRNLDIREAQLRVKKLQKEIESGIAATFTEAPIKSQQQLDSAAECPLITT